MAVLTFNHLSLMDVIGTFCPPSVTAGIPADVGRILAVTCLPAAPSRVRAGRC